jgi:putative hydrolase of the HAD superfamily
MIKAVLFDLGGVYFEDGTDKFLKILSKTTDKPYEELYPIFRKGKSLEYRKNKITGKEFFNWAAKKLDTKLSGNELNRMWVSQYTEIPGIKQSIKKLKKRGIKVTILSDNVPERIIFLQKKYCFLDLFDDIVLSYEVNLTKASTKIFKLALSRIGIKHPKDVIFVDDREVNLKVAKKMGIKTIQYTSIRKLQQELDRYFAS